MSIDLYVSLLALFRLGAVALFLDPSAGRAHIEQCCARWKPDALFAIPKAHWLRLISGALRRIPRKVSLGLWMPGTRRLPRPWGNGTGPANLAESDDPALVTFTSGSTGQPKAALRTHRFLLAQHRALEASISLQPGEIDLATLPVFVLANLAAGLTTVIPDTDLRRPGAVDAGKVFAQINRQKVSRLTASPAFIERLVEYGTASGRKLPGLRKIYTGGAPVFPRLLDAARTLAPNAHVVAVYGSTEAEPIAHLSAADIAQEDWAAMSEGKGLLAGLPVKEVSFRVLNDRWGTPRGRMSLHDLNSDTMPPGETGEIVVTGEHVLKGYLGGIGDEETKFRVGDEVWHRTGDAGFLDGAGRLWLQGRCAARMDDGHGDLYPLGAECIAMGFPKIRRAAMLSQEGTRLLVVEGDASPKCLRDAVAAAGVEEVVFIPHIPVDKRHNAKIDYPALRRLIP